jgi:hypothetical protein
MWQNIPSLVKEYFAISQNANSHDMKIFSYVTRNMLQNFLPSHLSTFTHWHLLPSQPIHPLIARSLALLPPNTLGNSSQFFTHANVISLLGWWARER